MNTKRSKRAKGIVTILLGLSILLTPLYAGWADEWVECSKCRGTAQQDCTLCDGTGTQACSDCGGTRIVEVQCSHCDGGWVTELCSYCDTSGIVQEYCSNCNGTGTMYCFDCGGTGIITEQCSHCDGTGLLECSYCDTTGIFQEYCSNCGGRGIVEVQCSHCDGGWVTELCRDCSGIGTVQDYCSACDGRGIIVEQCSHCDGGWVEGELCSYCDTSGIVQEYCSDCVGGIVEVQCFHCDGGWVTGPCSGCGGIGIVQDYCSNCVGGIIEVQCFHCDGGWVTEPCSGCEGTGIVQEYCNNCNGTGKTNCYQCRGAGKETCTRCDGKGKVLDQSEPSVHSLRERWLTELLTLRAEVRHIQKVLRRLDKSMQNDEQQREEWEKTTSEAYARALESAKSLFVDLTVGQKSYFSDKLEKATTREQRERFERALRLVQRLKDLQGVEDFAAWASNEEFGREEIVEGLKMIAELLLQDKKILETLGPNFALKRILTIKNAAGYIVNSAYDITAEVLSWRAINQLNKNSEAYLNAVNVLSTRMIQVVKRITEVKDKLEALPEEE